MMTSKDLTRAEVEALMDGTTPGPWSGHNMTAEDGRPMTPEEIGEYVCNSVRMGSPDRFLFVSGKHDDGGDCDVCHTGNGPKGPANTRLILSAPTLARQLLRCMDDSDGWQRNAWTAREKWSEFETRAEAAEAEVVRLREALIAKELQEVSK